MNAEVIDLKPKKEEKLCAKCGEHHPPFLAIFYIDAATNDIKNGWLCCTCQTKYADKLNFSCVRTDSGMSFEKRIGEALDTIKGDGHAHITAASWEEERFVHRLKQEAKKRDMAIFPKSYTFVR